MHHYRNLILKLYVYLLKFNDIYNKIIYYKIARLFIQELNVNVTWIVFLNWKNVDFVYITDVQRTHKHAHTHTHTCKHTHTYTHQHTTTPAQQYTNTSTHRYMYMHVYILSLTLVTSFFETSKLWACIICLRRLGVPRLG